MQGELVQGVNMWMVLVVLLWILPWKGVALYKAARLSHKKWFVVMLVVNTFGIIEMLYIYFVARKYTVETEESVLPTSTAK